MSVVDEEGKVIHPNRDVVPRRLIYQYSNVEIEVTDEIINRWVESILD